MEQLIYRTGRDLKRAWWTQALIESKKERRETGITVAQWCSEHNVSEKSYWYYHKKISDELALTANERKQPDESLPVMFRNSGNNVPVFAELKDPVQSAETITNGAAVICRGDIRIEISESVTDEFLLRIMRAVSHV